MAGPLEHRPRVAEFNDGASVHDRRLIGHLGHNAEVVADEEDGGAEALLELAQIVEDRRLYGHVQGGGRLIGDEHLGVQSGSDSDHDSLCHATR